MRQITKFFAVVFCLSSFVADAQQSFNKQKLDDYITAIDTNNQAIGAVTLSKNGKVIYNRAWGIKTINGNEQIKSDTKTIYRIGSISKMFTSVMILQLIEEGKLNYDTKLSKFFSEIPNANEITIEELLSHHSGLHNFTNDTDYHNYYTQPKTEKELISIISKEEADFKAGEKAEYSNTNFVLLGYIIEKITGKSYAQNLKKRITYKIGLSETHFGYFNKSDKNLASSFSYDGKNWSIEPSTDLSIPGGAGAVTSTTNDLSKFIEALFKGKLLKKETLDKMTTIKDSYGLGIIQFPFYDKTAFGHTGGIDQFHSMLGYFPKDSLIFAFTSNGAVMSINDIGIGVLSIYYNKDFTIPDFTSANIDVAKLPLYEGVYDSKDVPLKITIKQNGNLLTAQATGQSAFNLTAVSDTEFKFEPAHIKMDFTIEKDGSIHQFILNQNGMKILFTKE